MELQRILTELGFFLVLVLICELCRRVAKRRCPEAKSLVQGLRVGTLVLLWYSVSITLILFNKWIMVHWRDDGMPFPIFYTMSHMFLKGVFSSSYLLLVRCKPLPRARRKAFLGASFVGVMTGMDVAASNLSFLYISVSFYTMLKSASLIFILVLATSARIEKCSWGTVATITTISAGAFVMTYGEVEFNVLGFSLVMGSEVAASMRWIATQVLLQDESLDAMGAVLYMSPASTLSLLPLTIAREHQELALLKDLQVAAQYIVLVLFPGFLAFLLLVVEVLLVKETSSLTLSVFGNLKSVVTILLSIIVFRERTTPVQWVGLSVALLGMFAYSYVKKKHMGVDALASLGYESLPQEDELDVENRCGEVKTVLDDLEDLSTDAPVCTDLTPPGGPRTGGAPEAACVGKLQAEESGTVSQEDVEVCAASPSSSSRSGADLKRPTALGKSNAEAAADGAGVRLEKKKTLEARGAEDGPTTFNASACDATPESPSQRRKGNADGVEAAAATVGGSASGDGTELGQRAGTRSPTAGDSGDGNEGASDNSGGSWCLEDGANSPVLQGRSVKAVGQLDTGEVACDQEEVT